jgi:hypothetical protein
MQTDVTEFILAEVLLRKRREETVSPHRTVNLNIQYFLFTQFSSLKLTIHPGISLGRNIAVTNCKEPPPKNTRIYIYIYTWCWRRMEISWTDRVRNEEVLHTVKEERNILHTTKRRKANWIGHILRSNCLLKHVIE